MRYWLYKCNRYGGPAGYSGDWRKQVFAGGKAEVQWGGDYSTCSPEVHNHLADTVDAGDVIVAYQTDERSIIGFCTITRMTGPKGRRKIWLTPVYELSTGFAIHEHKHGTLLEQSSAVNGPVMLRELDRAEMTKLVQLCAAPERVLRGKSAKKR